MVDRLAGENRVTVKRKLCDSLIGEWPSESGTILLAKPQTYMNRSGAAVQSLLRKFRIKAGDLVVVHDDLDLPFGRIRIRPRGKPGGHRGVLSVIEGIGNEEFFRVRVGIGRPPEGVDATDFVLESFTSGEWVEVDEVIARAAAAVRCLLTDGASEAMARFNRAV